MEKEPMATLEQQEIILRFIEESLEIPVVWYQGEPGVLERFQKTCCFHSGLQPTFTVQELKQTMERLQPNILYEMIDVLGIQLLFLRSGHLVMIVGPYVTESLDVKQAQKLLLKIHLPISLLASFYAYYCSFRLLSESTVLRVVSAALHSFHPERPPIPIQTLRPDISSLQYGGAEDFQLEYLRSLKRYEQENRFLIQVSLGRPKLAIQEFLQLRKMSTGERWDRIPNLSDGIADVTKVRSLLRKVAEASGVNLVEVDRISRGYAQKAHNAQDIASLNRMTTEMITKYAEAVRRARQHKYSPPVSHAITYIELNLSDEMNVALIAKEIGFSAHYLGRCFKEETGLTITQYITDLRCKEAAKLLWNTDQPIQDIAASVGYLDNNYFTKIFRKFYQKTPSEYRRNKSEKE